MKKQQRILLLLSIASIVAALVKLLFSGKGRQSMLKTYRSADMSGMTVTIEDKPIPLEKGEHPPKDPPKAIPHGPYRPINSIGAPTNLKM